MRFLPRREDAVIDGAKVAYLLDGTHPQNLGKAAFFLMHGFTPGDGTHLADALRQHARHRLVVETRVTSHGLKHRLECSLETPDGRNPCITSIWVVEGDRPPRLITAYPRRVADRASAS